jgi:hypothetical protein
MSNKFFLWGGLGWGWIDRLPKLGHGWARPRAILGSGTKYKGLELLLSFSSSFSPNKLALSLLVGYETYD